MSRKPARSTWLVVEDHDKRRKLVETLLPTVLVNQTKLFNHGVPEDVAITAVMYAQDDEPDPRQEGWYVSTWRSPRGPLRCIYFMEVKPNGEKTLKIFDAYPLGREQY
ncbi:MAG TPA: hypothetical protein VI893_04195 [Thermoplasmata archaeon]|nr:hypothetical protein [Thermoplasmata archaeon]